MRSPFVASCTLLVVSLAAVILQAQDAAPPEVAQPQAAAAQTPQPPVDKAVLAPTGQGWTPLWKDTLTGWKVEPEFWKVDHDGVLQGHTPGLEQHHYAYTEQDYSDFELHADFKLVGHNSGICIRISPTSFDQVPGYQVDIGDGYWGSLWYELGRGMVVEFPKEAAEKIVKRDDWNHYFVRAQGHHIQAWLNGVKTFDVVDEKGPLTGPIGFQLCHGVGQATDVAYKNVVVRALPAAAKPQP